MNPVNYLANKINRSKKSKYNIVAFATHESYQEALAKTGHNFFIINPSNGKKWDEAYRKVPDNCVLVDDFSFLPYDIDIAIAQERSTQLALINSFSNISRVPVINIDHTEPIGEATFLNNIKRITSDFNVFITEHNKKSWGSVDGAVINHGIDTETFIGWVPNKKKRVVYIVNFLKARDHACGWREWEAVKSYVNGVDPEIEFTLIGNNPGVSNPINDAKKLASALSNSSCYLNTSKYSPLPMSLLEAMSMGMPIVSTRYQEVAKVLNNENSLSSNNIEELGKNIIEVCNNNSFYVKMGAAARRSILNNYSLESFVQNWNSLFNEAYNLRLGKKHEIFHIK